MLVLQTLHRGEQHGYGISQAIGAGTGDVLRVETGSLYPALHRLEKRRLIKATWRHRSQPARQILRPDTGGFASSRTRRVAMARTGSGARGHEPPSSSRRLAMAWSDLFARRPNDAEVDEEIRSHLALAAQDYLERGESPDRACRSAQRDLGHAPLIREDVRAVWPAVGRCHATGCRLCGPQHASPTGSYRGRGPDAHDWDRCQYGHLLSRERRAAQTAQRR